MSESMYNEVKMLEGKFYKELKQKNQEAFSKLYTSSGSHCEFPEFPNHLKKTADNEIGWWTVGDPSKNMMKSWIVGKWQSFQPELQQKVFFFNVFEKLLPIIGAVLVAWLVKLSIDEPEKFEMVREITKKPLKMYSFI